MILRARQHQFRFPRPMVLMGVINVTPDSFSDGGKYFETGAAVERALQLVEEGAEILDIGGESTRPGAQGISENEELRRVMPVVERLASATSALISIDTMKPGVARAAVAAGAGMVNDVGANRTEEAMWRLIGETGAGYVAMHMQGEPSTMQRAPVYEEVVEEVGAFFGDRLERLRACGVQEEQVALDVGIGFGKTMEHNLQLLRNLGGFTKWERPLLLGVSRKSFLGKLLGTGVEERLPASIACACWAVRAGVRILRTHDVAATRQAVRMYELLLKEQSECGKKLPS